MFVHVVIFEWPRVRLTSGAVIKNSRVTLSPGTSSSVVERSIAGRFFLLF